MAGSVFRGVLLSTALVLAVGPGLADPRFVSVVPGAAPGSWTATLAEAGGGLTLFADGKPVSAAIEQADGRVVARLTGLPPDTAFLGAADGGGAKPEAAVMLAPTKAAGTDLAIYHIMVGHFANGNTGNDRDQMRGWVHKLYAGGDLQGVLNKVDYIAGLGVTAVWLSPIFPAETSHGYDVMNYYAIGGARAVPGDPDASLALFRKVRDALQAKGIKVILDVPLNHGHSGYDRRNGDPKGHKPKATGAKQTAEKTWESWGSKFRYWDFEHEPTRRFLKDVALYWLVEEKADGLRLDYVRGVPNSFWAELYQEVKTARPDAVLIGEAWDDAAGPAGIVNDIAGYLTPVEGIGPQFDAAFDFPVQYAIVDGIARGPALAQLETWLQAGEAAWGATGRSAYFLDNHDLSRLNAWANDDDKVLAAVGFAAALSGPVSLFYGTETGLSGPAAKRGFNDDARIPMPWDGLNQDMVARFSAYLTARKENPVLHRGARLPLLASDDTLVMAKVEGGTVALVGLNLSGAEKTVTLDTGALLPDGATLRPLAGGGPAPTVSGGKTVWTLPAKTAQYALKP